MLELIMFLESTFNIKIELEEMLPENLDSVCKAAAFVRVSRLLRRLPGSRCG